MIETRKKEFKIILRKLGEPSYSQKLLKIKINTLRSVSNHGDYVGIIYFPGRLVWGKCLTGNFTVGVGLGQKTIDISQVGFVNNSHKY